MEENLVKSILTATANVVVPPKRMGRPRTDNGLLIDTFIRVLRTGMPWRDVRDVDFRTAHRHFILWARAGIFEKAYIGDYWPSPIGESEMALSWPSTHPL